MCYNCYVIAGACGCPTGKPVSSCACDSTTSPAYCSACGHSPANKAAGESSSASAATETAATTQEPWSAATPPTEEQSSS